MSGTSFRAVWVTAAPRLATRPTGNRRAPVVDWPPMRRARLLMTGVAALSVTGAAAAAQSVAPPDIGARSYILVEPGRGRVVARPGPDALLAMGSHTHMA